MAGNVNGSCPRFCCAGQHVVRDVDRNGFPGEGIHRAGARRHAAHAPRLGDALALRALPRLGDVPFDGVPVFGRGELADPLVFGGDDHERHAEDRVGTRGEDFELAVRTLDVEEDLRADRTADPVALDLLERVAPFEPLQPVEHPLGVGRHAEQPLLHALLLHGIASAHRQSVAHLVVGQHRAQLRTPVHHRVGSVGQTVVLQHLLAPHLVPGVPLRGRETHFGRAGDVQPLGPRCGEGGLQLLDRTRLLPVVAVVGGEHFEEGPLRPLVVLRIARAHLAVPVEREADLVELLAVAGDVALGRHGRVLSRLDGVLLGRKTERVVTHRVQDVESLEAFVARIDVQGDVAQRMPDVQARSRRIGKHVEDVEFGPRGVRFDAVGLVLSPALLPPGFDLLEIVLHIWFRFIAEFPAKLRKTFRIPRRKPPVFPVCRTCRCPARPGKGGLSGCSGAVFAPRSLRI